MSPGVRLIAGGKDFDAYLAEVALERILDEAVGGERGEAVQSFRGDEASWAQVLDAARTRSLFAPSKAVVVRGAEALRGDEEGLLGYLKEPVPGVTLVLVAARPDRRKVAWKRLFEAAQVTLAEPLRGRRLRDHVGAELRRRNLALEADALDALIEGVGADLRRLLGELDKLEAFAAGQRLDAAAVARVLGRGFARPLYELSDAFCERRAARALQLIEGALDEGEPALRILATLHRGLRQLRAARGLQAARVAREEMLGRLGLRRQLEFKLPALLEAARRWSDKQLSAATGALLQADRAIKTGGDARAALLAAVTAACAGGEARPSPASAR